ncbi:MAG: chloride channel protein [Bacteroidota bacterium]|nr:chloride channel protein [Bacteroidota bacterium]MDP4213873.1 chloride channel protein [Bacteroidota bacterium]MDP4251759.1 chloride channel protein [Bacteroidota bacterium]
MEEAEGYRLRVRIRRRLKRIFDSAGNERLKNNLLQALPFWIGSVLTGLVAVYYSKIYLFLESTTMHLFKGAPWLVFVMTPALFLLGWWFVIRFDPYAKGSGIPQVMAAIEMANPKDNHKIPKLLNLRIILVKMLSSFSMILGGGLIGREGPTIQIAGSIFRKVNQWLPDWWPKISKRNMIMTGAAAGLAAAFNTPLGGIVFAVEELTKTHISYFKTALFTAVIISGLTAQALFGPYLYLGYPGVNNLSGYIFLGVILVAVLGGLAGSFTSRSMLWIMNWKKRFKKRIQQIVFVLICGFAVALLAYFSSPSLIGSGKQIMTSVLFTPEKYLPWYAPVVRIFGSIFSYSTGAAGGVFAPALASGASIGSVLSSWMHLSDSDTNLLILSGMVGFLTGITRTPFTSAILVLEMTDRHSLIFYLMLAGMLAGLVSTLVDQHSFYDHLKMQYLREEGVAEATPLMVDS